MAHYPLYTQNLSLVGVCVKRIGKTASNETIFKSSLSLFDDLEYVVAKNR